MRTYYPNAAPRSPAAPSPAVTELMMECEADSEEETPLRPAALAPKQQHPLAILSHTPVPTRSKPVGALATLKEEEGEGRHAVECEGEAAEQQQQGHEQEQGQAQAQAQEQDGELETVAAEASTCRATTPLQDAQRARNPGLAALADLAVTAPPLAPATTLPTLSTPVAPFTPVAVAAPKAKGEGAQAAGAAKPFICAVPGCEKNYMDQQGMDQHYEFNHPELPLQRPAPGAAGTAIGVGSRVVDSAGAFGEIIARNGAWLTMRTDAGEERNVRKVDLELVTPEAGAGSCLPQMETTSQPTPPPAPAPAVGGGGTEAEPAAAGKEVAAPKATGECVQAARTAIGVGSRVVDSAGAFGEIIARNGAWLTMRTDAGEERNVRKVDLELVTPEAEAMPEAAAAYSLRQRGTQPHVKVGTAVEAAVEDAPEPPEHISPSDGLVTEVDGLQLHLSAASSTGYRGVVDYSQSGKERDRPFKAQATAPRVRTLGHFATKVEAAVCYAKWALQEGRGQAVAVPEDMEAAALAHARSVDSARRADERGGVLDSGPKAAAAQQGAAAAALGAAGAAAAPTAASGSAWEAKRRGRSAAPEWQLAEAAAEPEAKRRCVSVSAVAPGSLSSAATDAKRPRRATGSELASPVQRAEPLLFGRRASAPEQSGQRHATEGAS